jgi:hypothetical protein
VIIKEWTQKEPTMVQIYFKKRTAQRGLLKCPLYGLFEGVLWAFEEATASLPQMTPERIS